jgi:hypothetical protein
MIRPLANCMTSRNNFSVRQFFECYHSASVMKISMMNLTEFRVFMQHDDRRGGPASGLIVHDEGCAASLLYPSTTAI